jgi:hypothetical protein
MTQRDLEHSAEEPPLMVLSRGGGKMQGVIVVDDPWWVSIESATMSHEETLGWAKSRAGMEVIHKRCLDWWKREMSLTAGRYWHPLKIV